jgi:multiple sugar transport system substrate-binding protein
VSLQAELGIAPTAQTTATIGDNAVLFINNKLAMFDTGIWPLQSFLQTPDLEFGTVLPPAAPNGNLSCVLHQADWCLNPDSENIELAWEALKWMVSPEAAAVWGRSGFSLPAQPAVVEELGLLDDPIRSTFFEAVEHINTLPWFIRTTNGPEVEEELNLAIQSAFLGEASVEDAFKAAAPIIDSILQS